MKRALFSTPDPFSTSPFLALLPVRGKISKLEGLTSSLFARFEKVRALEKELAGEETREHARRLTAEREMLEQVLDWLMVKPQGNDE